MPTIETLIEDARTLYHLTFKRERGQTHAERLESFYAGQSNGYDRFRERLLHGREAMLRQLELAPGEVWVDMGGGTGANVECIGDTVADLQQVYIVDLAPSLLNKARERIARRQWRNVEVFHGDATRFHPPAGKVDVVTFSYSLTMIPNWFAAIEHAKQILKPGGRIGIVDFYVSPKHPDSGRLRHKWSTRAFWPLWFAMDNVFLSPDHLPFLSHHFKERHIAEGRGKVPYLPVARAPYYIFIGMLNTSSNSTEWVS